MLLCALRATAMGTLTPEQVRELREYLQLDNAPRTEGPAAAWSIAHRRFTTTEGARLIRDLDHSDGDGWTMALFYETEGGRPTPNVVEEHRAQFRSAMERFGLEMIEIEPAATADEVFVMSPPPPELAESGIGLVWDLPYDNLDHMWMHLGLRRDSPQEVKAVKLREVMRMPVWSVAPEGLRRQAEEFLRDN